MADDLREQQYTLARHLRDPAGHSAPPGIEERRMRVYRDLFFNNIESLLASGFPVIRKTLGAAKWRTLARTFFAIHRSRTPLFTEIAAEFVAFIEGRCDESGLPLWLAELAHYEWVEQALFISDAQFPAHDPDGDLLDGIPLLSPLAWPLAYRWPVTDIGSSNMPDCPPEEFTLLLVHRDADHHVHFARVAPLAFRLLVDLSSERRTGRQHLAALAVETGADPFETQELGRKLLQQLHAQGVVLGTLDPRSIDPSPALSPRVLP